MEEIMNNELSDIVSKIIEYWKKKQIPQMFFPSNYKKLYEENVKLFVVKYPIITYEILDFIVKYVSNDDEIEPIDFLFSIRKQIYDEENIFCIVRYIFEKFNPKEIEKYSYYLYDKEKLPSSEKTWFDYIKFLYKYDFIKLDKIFQDSYDKKTRRTKILLQNYISQCGKINQLEEENCQLKKKIEEMELHLKYMPGGEGYMEAKEDFEHLQ
jgi:hypothetical protein